MRLSTLLFLASVGVSAGFALVARLKDDRSGFTLFKPLTTFIVLLGAAFLLWPAPQPYRGLVVLGLGCSLAGDVLLLPQLDRFGLGLLAFLLAHLAYFAAFSTASPISPHQLPWLLPFGAAGAAVVFAAWPGLGRLRAPVVLYAAVIAAMAWRAFTRFGSPSTPASSAALALAGALAFMASDAILAVRRFRRPFAGAQLIELTVYWIAQTMIALSVRL
jgi:alkenylglycerophosphocholine/alkenylglycerophosphoethanolamine hydrolase